MKKEKMAIRIVRSTELRLEEWRRSPELVAFAMKLFRDPQFGVMLDVLRTESPSNQMLPATGVMADDRLAHAGRIEGYHLALNNLESMAKQATATKQIEATFEPERGLTK